MGDLNLDKSIYDGRWHHVAFVAKTEAIEPTEANGNATEQTSIRVYVDYRLAKYDGKDSYVKVGYHLPFKSMYSPRPRLSIGTGATDAERWAGAFDEVRISRRALEPTAFLRATKEPRGAMVIVR